MIRIPIDELDIIFISYDEPAKEKFWSTLINQYPFAKRVDGVTGFDAAHKAAAELSETERFITVDGDTIVDDDFFDMVLFYDQDYYDHVFSWSSTNAVNGLVYGNGSLKCWTREVALNMNTHENAYTNQSAIEFCWTIPYLSMYDTYSTTYPAETPYHGFRAGFREGVKLAMNNGRTVQPNTVLFDDIWYENAHGLICWSSIGADQPNGLWCIYGARMGLNMINQPDWDFQHIADYIWFDNYWEDIINKHKIRDHSRSMICKYTNVEWDPEVLKEQILDAGQSIYAANGKFIPLFDADQSILVKDLANYRPLKTNRVLFTHNEMKRLN